MIDTFETITANVTASGNNSLTGTGSTLTQNTLTRQISWDPTTALGPPPVISPDPLTWYTEGAGIIGTGGRRSVTVSNYSSDQSPNPSGAVNLGNLASNPGEFSVTQGQHSVDVNLNYANFSEDLVAAEIGYFDFFIDADATALGNLTIDLELIDSSSSSASDTFSFALGELVPGRINNVEILSLLSTPGFDASDVTEVNVTFSGGEDDDYEFSAFKFNSEDTPVPEPSPVAAIIPIAVAVAFTRRRRKQANKGS